ncbi:MAG: IS481 family transposase [Campylobacteraceae bacterium]|nr:IS481 family transposase [Campylobacteraceae bacterium]
MLSKEKQREINRKSKVLKEAQKHNNVSFACRRYGISRNSFYRWKKRYKSRGEEGLINSKPCPQNVKIRISIEIEEKIIHLRKNFCFGPIKISWYIERYYGLKVSQNGVRGVLLRYGLNILPKTSHKHSQRPFKRYEKQMPGHHVQVDVKFLFFQNEYGKRVKKFQYTAIDDATRIRALKIYDRHTQDNAVDFIDYVVGKFPFRIKVIRTDNGHEFQSKFHWHIEDLGMIHVYIRPATPRLNGKVERSHLTDKQEFYQLLDYKDDVDLKIKLKEWENFYNFHRPHGSLKGKTPYETLVSKLALIDFA